ncbi:MAG: acyloxyacyl hydrolase [Flavobacteriales bacterium]|nr:acyloxyacyl hydrolase [Flavobacteriales bacterium]
MLRFLLLLILICPNGILHSQDSPIPFEPLKKSKKWLLAPHYGFIAPHTSQMEHLIQGHSRGIQASCLWSSKGNQSWEKTYNYPDTGADLFVNYTGNSKQLGTQVMGTFFIDLPLNKMHFLPSVDLTDETYSEPWHKLGLGIGLGYTSKIWDLESNRQANVIGSKINAALVLQYKLDLFKTDHFSIHSGLRISHYSNGSMQLPNLGTNNISLFAAMSFQNTSARKLSYQYTIGHESLTNDSLLADRGFSSTLGFSMGLKEIPPPYGKKFTTYSLTYLIDKRISRKSSLGIGADIFRNASIGVLLERRDNNESQIDIFQSGLLLSYTMHFNNFEMKIQQGFYIIDKWKDNGFLYHRFGLRYLIDQKWFLHLMLKTHFAKADHGELGFGYRF